MSASPSVPIPGEPTKDRTLPLRSGSFLKVVHALRRIAFSRLMCIALFAWVALAAFAQKRLTIDQLQAKLTAASERHKPDAEIARQIATMELSEQLTEASLERLNLRLAPGAQTTKALAFLADRSAFLDPPVAELPGTAAPDSAAQQRMLDAARYYVARTLPRLPDFLATRTINRYDDSPQTPAKGGWPVRAGMHLAGTSSREISVRDETKSQAAKERSVASQEQNGLSSWGEFGYLPRVILSDTLQGTVTWSHWEQTAAGMAAVFHYAVPRSASHYEVIGSFTHGSSVHFDEQHWNDSPFRTTPAYHGSLWVEPATGTILRVSIEVDANDINLFRQMAVMVKYAPVQIGGREFICPVKSLASQLSIVDVNLVLGDGPTEWLNVASYTNYHRFASTTRILPNTQESQSSEPESAGELPRTVSAKPNETASAIEEATPAQSALLSSSSPLDSSTESPPTVAAPLAPAPAAPAPTVAARAESTPAVSAAQPANEPKTPATTIRLNVNRLLLPVVVRDKQGRAVGGLMKEDFQVFDNERPRAVSAFTVEDRHSSGGSGASNPTSGAVQTESADPAAQPQGLPQRITVFLFDDLHLSFEDMASAKKAATKALADTLTGTDMAAVVSMSGKTNSGLTRDRAKLQNAIVGLQPRLLFQADGADCPKIDYYQADLIENKHDPTALQDAMDQVMFVCTKGTPPGMAQGIAEGVARRILNLGNQDVQTSYATIGEYVRRIATLPGQRTLVLVSPGFISLEPGARTAESRVLDLAAQSNVTISALDARGLYTGTITASDDTRGRSPDLVADYRLTSMRLGEDTLGELSDGSGGTFLHNSNDLEAGFKSLIDAPEVVYVLELALDGVKTDGSYHRLKVKLNRDHLDLQARRGYFMPKPAKEKK